MRTGGIETLLDGLVPSKLRPPIVDPRSISRAASASRAIAGLPRGRVVTIVAPAGSGKSSLMAQIERCFAKRDIDTGWLGLDAEDNDPATFARYFISALHAVDPLFAREELTALGANPVRDFGPFFARLTARLATLEAPLAIFLDDFQHLHDPILLRFFDGLIERLPESLSVVIGSRRELSLHLARLSVADRAVEIRQDELNFDRDQTDLFLRRYHQIELPPPDLERLVELTEGWPTGVQLAALALRRHRGSAADLLQTFSGRDRDLTRYLAEAVIRAQPEEVLRFLLRTSVLHRMSAALCEAVVGNADAGRLLEEVGRANLFVIALDREERWYRYHHLFAEFLQNEFRRTDPSGYQQACVRAAQWCDDNNEPAEAIRYALDAEQYEQAAELIARRALQTSPYRGDHYSVRNWMRRLPAAWHAHRPELLLAHAWACAFSRDTQHAMSIAVGAVHELKSGRWDLSDDDRARWLLWAEVVQAATCACADSLEECRARSSSLLPRVPPSEPFLIATLGNCLSYSHFAQGNLDGSRQYANLAHEQGLLADAAYLSAWGDFLQGMVDVELGRLRAAGRFCERIERDSAGLGLGQRSYVAGLSALLRAEVAVQRGDFDSAGALIDVGRAFKEIFGPVEPQFVAIRSEARLLARQHSFDHMQSVLEEGQDAALREKHERLYASLAMEQVSLLLTAGRLEGARAVVARARVLDAPSCEGSAGRSQRAAIRLLEARMRLADGDFRHAMRILTTLQQAIAGTERGARFLSITAHRAVALWSLGQSVEAMRQLDRALGVAEAEHHVYPILSAGRPLLPILGAMGQRRRAEDDGGDVSRKLRLQQWLEAELQGRTVTPPIDDTMPASGAASPAATDLLTDREIELLGLVRKGFDNRRIADTLFVSLSTVKWHLHNVYEKLDVSSRSAAVARAVRLGML